MVLASHASVDQFPVAKLEGMVTSIYHSQKPELARRRVDEAQSLRKGRVEEGRGEGRSRSGQGPQRGTTEVMTELIILSPTAENASPKRSLCVPMSCGPRIDDCFKNSRFNAGRTPF